MIKVEEKKPNKLSGITSLFISFDYNPDLVNIIKGFSPAVFNKKELTWEIPSYYLSKLLDAVTYYDDIELRLFEEPVIGTVTDLSKEEIDGFKIKPYEHQIEAINYGLSHDKWLNLSYMGLGKSFEAMCLAETLHRRGLIEHCLLICGVDSLRQNWKAEINKFSNETCMVLGERINKNNKVVYETLPKRAAQLKNKIDEFFIITNISNIRDDKFVEAFKNSENKIDMIIFDESHRASKHSQQGNNLLKLNAKYKVAMTGTPIVNTPLSAYLMLSWTDNDKSTLTNFKSQYINFGGFHNAQILGYKNLESLKEEIDNCSIRRTFSQVRGDMPKKTIEYETLEMNEDQVKFYTAIKDGVKEEANKIELNSANLLALMTRLRQATSAPGVLTTDPPESIKVLRAAEIAEDIINQGEKVLIFSNFKEPVYDLAGKLSKYNPLIGTGDQSEGTIKESIDKFRNSDNKLLIGTLQKLGTGFSMPECHYAIFIDQPFTQALFGQACDRIYRITSDQPVFIKVLVAANTVDERVRMIVENKRDLSDYMIDNQDNKFSEEMRDIILG